jgi:hypothetical protein
MTGPSQSNAIERPLNARTEDQDVHRINSRFLLGIC